MISDQGLITMQHRKGSVKEYIPERSPELAADEGTKADKR